MLACELFIFLNENRSLHVTLFQKSLHYFINEWSILIRIVLNMLRVNLLEVIATLISPNLGGRIRIRRPIELELHFMQSYFHLSSIYNIIYFKHYQKCSVYHIYFMVLNLEQELNPILIGCPVQKLRKSHDITSSLNKDF